MQSLRWSAGGRGENPLVRRAQRRQQARRVKTGASQRASATPGKLPMAGLQLCRHAGTVRPLNAGDLRRRQFAAAATEPAVSIPPRRPPTAAPLAESTNGAVL
jgi:hypothetical protein